MPHRLSRFGPVFHLCFSIAMVLGTATTVSAAQPVFNGPTPRGGQRGTELDVLLTGNRLADTEEVLFYEPGIEVTSLEVVNTNQVKAKFKIAADALPGAHRIRVRTATGLSELRAFMVGNLTEVTEVEPNSDFAAPQVIAMNSTVNGVADNEDVDYFVVEAKKGERITAEVEGMRLGITMFDPYVSIMNEARFELATSDDAALLWQDCVASIVAPEDGRYIVQVRECSYAGNGSGLYRVHIGNFPRPIAVYPAGGKSGTEQEVTFLGDVLGDRKQRLTLPADKSAPYSLFAQDESGIAPSQSWFRVTELENTLEVEPNESPAQATVAASPAALAFNGIIGQQGDIDNFRFTAKAGEVYDIRVHARSIRSPLDPVLYICNKDGGVYAGNDDSGGPDAYLRFQIPADGDYFVNVRDHLGNGGPHYVYRAEVTRVQPSLTLTPAEFQQYVQPTVSVPSGGRAGLVIIGTRADFGGPLALRGDNLPPGVTLEAPNMPGNLTVTPVIFSAATGTPNAGRLADIFGSLADPNQPNTSVEGRLVQTVTLIRGLNQIPVWNEYTNKLPIAVTNELPFDIAIVEPKVPMVRGGQMALKVTATRKPGFTAPIKIDMLWVPPGLGASGSISIPENATEASIPLNAAGNAELNTWKIAVRGRAAVGDSTVENCTPFANLRIADRYVNFAFERAAVEQGTETEMVVRVTKNVDFEGEAVVDLYGLPAKTTTTQLQATRETTDLIFKIKAAIDSPAGNHGNLFCRVIITEHGEPIVHNIGTGQLRIDVPLPPKADEPPPPTPMPTTEVAAAPDKPPEKRLTRLEQLRLEQAEKEKARKARQP
jgi:hypothetical protein